MKQEDIDKKIDMPDVDAEWARFEREVINQKTASRKPLYWGIGIAASIALVAGIFLFGHDVEAPQQLLIEQTAQQFPAPVGEGLGVGTVTPAPSQSGKLQPPPPFPPLLASLSVASVPEGRAGGRGVAAPSVAPSAAQNSTKPDLLAQAEPPATETAVYDCGEVMPQFPGGDRALMEFIKTNMHYPDLAMEYGARGRVVMNFLIDSTGCVSNIKPVKLFRMTYDTLYMNRLPMEQQVALKQQIDSLLGKEGVRIISQMPRWTPRSLFGKNVSVRFTLPIDFDATEAERETYLAQKQAADDELQDSISTSIRN